MDTQEMMERLLATINANQAKSDAARKADKEEILAGMKANMGSMQDELKRSIKEMKFNRERRWPAEKRRRHVYKKETNQPQWTLHLRWLMIEKS
jgi:hypothetical protein